jgi:sulfate transport system ATP-binding protein
MSIFVNSVYKNFGTFQALENINLEVKEGSLVALLGPSGSGKSTLLRAIAGLEAPDHGQVMINGQDTTHVDIRRRNIGFVFQHYALFKHLTIRQNVAFGLEIRQKPKHLIRQRVEELLDLVQLKGLGDRYPTQLSGGQRQRVALARALAVQPQVLLLDEPFGALDAKVRKELRAWLRRLHEEVHVTSIFVTHDQEEAMEVADEIVVMNQGRIDQVGSPAEIYDHPATPFVMNFIGEVNVLPSHHSLIRNHTESFPQQNAHEVFVRPHDLEIQSEADEFSLPGTVKRIIYRGSDVQIEVLIDGQEIVIAHLSRDRLIQLQIQVGQTIYLKPKQAKVFGANLAPQTV